MVSHLTGQRLATLAPGNTQLPSLIHAVMWMNIAEIMARDFTGLQSS